MQTCKGVCVHNRRCMLPGIINGYCVTHYRILTNNNQNKKLKKYWRLQNE